MVTILYDLELKKRMRLDFLLTGKVFGYERMPTDRALAEATVRKV